MSDQYITFTGNGITEPSEFVEFDRDGAALTQPTLFASDCTTCETDCSCEPVGDDAITVSESLRVPDGVFECEPPTNKRFMDLTGQQYGRLTVVRYFGKSEYVRKGGEQAGSVKYHHYWSCECECGERRIVRASSLRSGDTTSCGCYSREVSTTHGLGDHPSYYRYYDMVRRCTDPSHPKYPGYGGRGITIYPAWLIKKGDVGLKKYLWFIDKILGPCPGPEYTVDRTDNDRGYYPWNLQWADKSEQARNRRDNKLDRNKALMIKFGGIGGSQEHVGNMFGVNRVTVSQVRRGKSWANLTQADYDALSIDDIVETMQGVLID